MDDKKVFDEYDEINQNEELDNEVAVNAQSGEDIAVKSLAAPVSLAASSDDEKKIFTDFKEYAENPFTYFETGQVNVQLASASFRYEVTDFVLPGRNGFDLTIARRYDSSCANIRDFSTNLIGVGLDYEIKTGSRDNRHNIGTYGLGYGWSFILPSIESIPTRVYGQEKLFKGADGYILHLEDGRSLKINKNFNDFVDYNLKDVEIIDKSGRNEHPVNASITSRYDKVIEYKNGNRDYYKLYKQYTDSHLDLLMSIPHYKLVARTDRFGNMICFNLTDYGGMTIVDTWGRELKLEKNGNKLNWILPNGVQGDSISYEIRYEETTEDYGYTPKPYALQSATNLIGKETEYEYYDESEFIREMKFGTTLTYSTEKAKRPYMLLMNVKYPNKAVKHFSYEKNRYITYRDDDNGYIEHFPLLAKNDKAGDTVYNQINYSYTMGSNNTYIEKAEITRHDNIKESHIFTNEGLRTGLEIHETVQGNKILISKSVYKYDDNKLMTSAEDETYGRSNSSKFLRKKTSWEYSKEASITKETVEYHEDSSSNQEVTTTYGAYNIPLEITRTKGSGTIRETNELHPDKDQVVKYHRIYENGVLKEKTVYDYGTSDYAYCLTSEKRYFTTGSGSLEASGTYAETVYQYNSAKYTHQPVVRKQVDIKDADGNTCASIEESYDYDRWGRVIKKTDPRGQTHTYLYDNLGRIKTEVQPSVSGQPVTNQTDYNDENNYVTKTDANGQKTRIQYTPFGQVLQVWLAAPNNATAADILLKDFVYNTWGELVTVNTYNGTGTGTDKIKRTEEYTYDSFGRVKSRSILQTGYKEKYEYDEVSPDPEGGTRNYYKERMEIEGDSNAPAVITIVYKDQNGQMRKEYLDGVRMATYDYDNAGNNIQKLDAEKRAEQWEYDYAGRVVKRIRSNAGQKQTVSFVYDALGNKSMSRDEAGNETKHQYDKAGRLIHTTAPLDTRNQEVKYFYDAAGNITWEKIKREDGWQEIQHVYDVRNRLTDMYQYLSTSNWIRTRYQYDALDRVTWMRTGDTPSGDGAQVTTYTYDRFGNVLTMTDARTCTEYKEYDKVGILQTKTDRNGNKTAYQYDALDRLIKETVQNTTADGLQKSEREYTYGKTGNLIRETSRETAEGETSVLLESKYYYNAKGQLKQQDDPGNIKKYYNYDKNGNRQSFRLLRDGQTVPDISLYYIYDDLYRLKQVRRENASGTILAEYEYDERGNRKVLRYPQNNMETSYEYNKANRITSMETKRQGTKISAWKYEYDMDGNLLKKTDTTSSTPITISYRYDRLGRLIEEDDPKWKRVLYEYDEYSNRTRMMVEGKTKDELVSVTTYEYDPNNRLSKETRKEGKVTELWQYRYDDNGNETFRIWEKRAPRPDYPGSVSLSGEWRWEDPICYEYRHYNGLNQLIRINQDEQEITYRYRGDGMRHSSIVRNLTESNGKTKVFYWDGDNIVAEQTDGGSVNRYLRGINLIAREADSVVYYYVHNEHGDVVQLWTNGSCKGSYEYDAFGNEKSPSKEDENPFRYCGEYYDLSSSTYYLRARDYRPSTGRFTSEDPARDGLNWYTYCSNNPVLKSDPTGLYEVYDPHTRAYVNISDAMEASRYATTPYERLRILVESQGWNVPDNMSLELVYYVNMSPYNDGISMANAVMHGDLDFWYPLAEHQYMYWQGVEYGKGVNATIGTLAVALTMSANDVPPDGSKKYGSNVDVSEQKMYQQGQHYNKHGKDMGYLSKKAYEQGARNFIENNRTTADIYEAIWNSSRGGQGGQTQIIMQYGGEQVIINKATGQIIDYYTGTSLNGFIKIRRVQ